MLFWDTIATDDSSVSDTIAGFGNTIAIDGHLDGQEPPPLPGAGMPNEKRVVSGQLQIVHAKLKA